MIFCVVLLYWLTTKRINIPIIENFCLFHAHIRLCVRVFYLPIDMNTNRIDYNLIRWKPISIWIKALFQHPPPNPIKVSKFFEYFSFISVSFVVHRKWDAFRSECLEFNLERLMERSFGIPMWWLFSMLVYDKNRIVA